MILMPAKYIVSKEPVLKRIIIKSRILLRYLSYLHIPKKSLQSETVFFIVDPCVKQAGLADRLKAIVCTYYIAKYNDFSFKLYFRFPFDLEKYLLPNKVDWHCELKELDKSIFSSRLGRYLGELPIPILKKGRQYHYYWYRGKDLLRYLYSDEKDGEEKWKNSFNCCFNELFQLSPYLSNLVDKVGLTPRTYISVHFRFVNSLGVFEGNLKKFPVLSSEKQSVLINKCLNYLDEIAKENIGMPIVVFSDSMKFLNICKSNGYDNIGGGSIGNVAFSNGVESEDKTMVDFFIIGRSYKVYSVVLPGMYGGVFSEYAALIGNAQFQRLKD